MSDAVKVLDTTRRNNLLWGLGILIPLLLILYYSILFEMVMDWWENPDYSHGFLVPIVSIYFVWTRRKELARLPVLPNRYGLLLLLAGIGILILGNVGAELFLMRTSFIIVIAGLIVTLLGRDFLKELLFPVGFLIFMVPLPAIVFNAVAFPLQIFSAQAATFCLQSMQIPVFREGNLIHLSTSIMEVTEACSGIRSLMSLIALGTLFAYIAQSVNWKRVLIIVSSVPIAILANAFRVTGTGMLAHYVGEDAAQSFYHTFSGWLVFIVALGLLVVVGLIVSWIPDGMVKRLETLPETRPQRKKRAFRFPLITSAVILMLTVVVNQSISHGEPVIIRDKLENFPYLVNEWKSKELRFGIKAVRALGVSDYMMRKYFREADGDDSGKSLSLYVGYYDSQRKGATYHSPKNCLPGSGWEIIKTERVQIPVTQNLGRMHTYTVNKIIIQKGLEQQMILYWYQDRGRVIASEYWAKIYLVWDAMTKNRTDGALVRISVPMKQNTPADHAFEIGEDFAKQVFPILSRYLPG